MRFALIMAIALSLSAVAAKAIVDTAASRELALRHAQGLAGVALFGLAAVLAIALWRMRQ